MLLKAYQKPFINPVCQQGIANDKFNTNMWYFYITRRQNVFKGDKMYLKATNNHLIHLPPGVVYNI